MNKEIMRKFMRDMRLTNYFGDIKEYCEVTCNYIAGDCEVNDVAKLVVDLASIPDIIKEIEDIILEMAEEYEQEIKELKNE